MGRHVKAPVYIVASEPCGDGFKVYEAEADTFDECVQKLREARESPIEPRIDVIGAGLVR